MTIVNSSQSVENDERIFIHQVGSMTAIIQPMPWLRSASFGLAVDAGLVAEPDDKLGLSGLVCEMAQRGAGNRSSRQITEDLDNLGVDRNSGVTSASTSFSASMPTENLYRALAIYGDIVRRPHLPIDQLEDARAMAIQELRAIEDEPTHRVMRQLKTSMYGTVLGRSAYGNSEGLESISADDVREFFKTRYHKGGSLLAIAGKVEPDALLVEIEKIFGDWREGERLDEPQPKFTAENVHIELQSSQTHIGFGFPTVPYGHEDYFAMRAGIGVLSDGMSSRLFDRVREQRGLCYTVSASTHSLRRAGSVMGYAGTTPPRAQETLDVTINEINAVTEGLTQEEVDRWKVRIQSGLIMENESSASRAGSLISDYYQIGRVIPTTELEEQIEAIDCDSIIDFWTKNPVKKIAISTVGPDQLTTV
ncbi:MAG: pitrilysin family protein [Planctomycetota bacterium]